MLNFLNSIDNSFNEQQSLYLKVSNKRPLYALVVKFKAIHMRKITHVKMKNEKQKSSIATNDRLCDRHTHIIVMYGFFTNT